MEDDWLQLLELSTDSSRILFSIRCTLLGRLGKELRVSLGVGSSRFFSGVWKELTVSIGVSWLSIGLLLIELFSNRLKKKIIFYIIKIYLIRKWLHFRIPCSAEKTTDPYIFSEFFC